MGQATLDLPDPAPSAAPIGNADDLLSQLAGQEIDRLLADAEQNIDTPQGSPAQDVVESEDEEVKRLEKLLTQDDEVKKVDAEAAQSIAAPEPAAVPAPAKTAPPATTNDAYAEQVGKLLDELNVIPEKPTATEPQPVTSSADESTSVAERHALAPRHSETSQEPLVTMQQVLDEATGPRNVPLYVRGLELLNLPFSFCPDEIRDTLGKVAILTMMNSIGVLLYVVLFRKH